MSYNTPLLSNHLNDIGYTPTFFGFGMVIVSICYASSFKVVRFLTTYMSKRGVLFVGLLMQSSGVLITGTDGLSNWYNPGFFVVVGLIIFGFATAMVTIPVMPEILDAIEEEKQAEDLNEKSLHENLAGYFVVC
mmetsp:Transcript_11514/g.17353  ORF Transcript_11514/g.17353 Transcript_11514/m.17353 type:complete len:134 (+) Transcript_11514:905-1306(+)